jgi:hypothetical protein
MSDPVIMDPFSPYGITANKDVPAGYDHTLCVKCTNGIQEIEADNWSV